MVRRLNKIIDHNNIIGQGKATRQGRIVRIILMVISLLLPINAVATYGESCSPTPVSMSDSYFLSSTAYGYLLGNIDMKTNTPNGCNQPTDKLEFCIRGQGTNPCDFVSMDVGEQRTIAALSNNPDIGGNSMIGNIKVHAEVVDGNLCLIMPTSRGPNPVICRRVESTDTVEPEGTEECRNIARSCYRENFHSQSIMNFSGLTVQCLTESLDMVFFEGNDCRPDDANLQFMALRPFAEFQEALKVAIRAALILYVMVYGFKLVMNIENASLNEVVMFIIKFMLVAYFAVGLGPLYYEQGRFKQHNGMTDMALPVLVDATSGFAQMVFKAAGSPGLCHFDINKYENGYEYYGLWDAIDCRLGFYFGMQAIYNMADVIRDLGSTANDLGYSGNSPADFGSASGDAIEAARDPFNMSIFTVLFGFFLAGNILVVICGLVIAVMFLSIMFYFLTVYVVCTVTLYVLAYISPIFIPMALFERTKGYFDSWLRIVISVVLQPAVVAGFVALLLTFYDSTIYGNCEYRRHDYTVNQHNFSTFEIRIPTNEAEKCTESPGYKLTHYFVGNGWEERILIIFSVPIIQDVINLAEGMVYVLIFLLIFYYILEYVSEFVSDLTSGPSVAAVTVSAAMIVNAAISGAKKLGGASESQSMKDTKLSDGKNNDQKKGRSGDDTRKAMDDFATGGGPKGGGGGSGKGSDDATRKAMDDFATGGGPKGGGGGSGKGSDDAMRKAMDDFATGGGPKGGGGVGKK